jgi:hypothetical protein
MDGRWMQPKQLMNRESHLLQNYELFGTLDKSYAIFWFQNGWLNCVSHKDNCQKITRNPRQPFWNHQFFLRLFSRESPAPSGHHLGIQLHNFHTIVTFRAMSGVSWFDSRMTWFNKDNLVAESLVTLVVYHIIHPVSSYIRNSTHVSLAYRIFGHFLSFCFTIHVHA